MFYQPENGHGLPHNPFNAIVSPRPIGWISSRSKDGIDNLAPYSFFNGVQDVPPMVMYSTTGRKLGRDEEKDSLLNIRETGEFCVSIVSAALQDAMNATSAHLPLGEDEYAAAGLTKGTDINLRVINDAAPHRDIGLAWRKSAARKVDYQLLVELLKDLLG